MSIGVRGRAGRRESRWRKSQRLPGVGCSVNREGFKWGAGAGAGAVSASSLEGPLAQCRLASGPVSST